MWPDLKKKSWQVEAQNKESKGNSTTTETTNLYINGVTSKWYGVNFFINLGNKILIWVIMEKQGQQQGFIAMQTFFQAHKRLCFVVTEK